MIPDPPQPQRAPRVGGKGSLARDGSGEPSRAAGHIRCVICLGVIELDDYRSARCWTDPTGITVAAHRDCLVRVGETELNLPPDPGEHTTATVPGEAHEHASGFRVVDSP